MKATDEQLVRAFHQAAIFLIHRMKTEGWHWSSNYLREHARVATGLQCGNERSPRILRKLLKAHPELKPYVRLKPLTRLPEPWPPFQHGPHIDSLPIEPPLPGIENPPDIFLPPTKED